jgi:hypothetical protein
MIYWNSEKEGGFESLDPLDLWETVEHKDLQDKETRLGDPSGSVRYGGKNVFNVGTRGYLAIDQTEVILPSSSHNTIS